MGKEAVVAEIEVLSRPRFEPLEPVRRVEERTYSCVCSCSRAALAQLSMQGVIPLGLTGHSVTEPPKVLWMGLVSEKRTAEEYDEPISSSATLRMEVVGSSEQTTWHHKNNCADEDQQQPTPSSEAHHFTGSHTTYNITRIKSYDANNRNKGHHYILVSTLKASQHIARCVNLRLVIITT